MVEVITKAMVMSAGMGSRLEPLTLLVPKPLVPVCNRPVMDILFENLANIGIKNVICNTYYLADQIIQRYKQNDLGINFNYITEDSLSGTAGGLKKCQFFFDKGEDFLVLSADGLTNADILRGIDVHKKSNAIATIGIKQISREDVSNFGVVVTDKEGFVTEFQEKPPIEEAKSNFINTGIYIFNYKIFDYIPGDTFYDFAKNVFPKLLAERQINTFAVKEYWSDIGTLEQYKKSVEDTFSGDCSFRHVGITNNGCGKYVTESEFSEAIKIVGNCVIGKNCQLGRGVRLENSIIWDNVKIADGVTLKDCIIASNEVVDKDLDRKVVGCNKIIEY